MSLLTIVQDAADRIGLPQPAQVVGSSDTQVRQLLGLAQQEGKELARRGRWEAITKEKTFTATATEEQSGAIPSDFCYMIEGSFWNRTQSRQVIGPLTSHRWQMLKTGLISNVWDAFRIRGGAILMNPTPTAGDSMAFEYISTQWCTNAAGDTYQAAWAADDDVSLLCEELHVLGLIWRWMRAKGFDYAEAMRTYETEVEQKLGRDGGQSLLNLNGDAGAYGPYDPLVPDGNWTI